MSSDSDDENTIRYGTPLEPYEEDEVPSKKKFQQPADQYALDSHGRRRFHGAFTGGFSAGFQNSVGTPEGWKPSTFKSSRSEKALVSGQRPEDFMDEEDRSEFGIAPRFMQTQSEFSGQKRPRPKQFHDGPIPGKEYKNFAMVYVEQREPVLEQLLRPVHETAAVKILRAMGWRPGQGAGQRVSRKEKRDAASQHRVYGCFIPPHLRTNQEQTQSEGSSSDSEYDFETLYAPDDYEPYVLNKKTDKFGLGYSGLSRHSVLGNLVGEYGEGSSRSHLVMKDKGRKVSIRGQAFGVGAFEADDDDIYATQDMSHYDFAIGGPQNEANKQTAKRDANVLEGFIKASKALPTVTSHPPPALPRGYTPAPRRSRFQPTEHTPRDQGLGRHELTPEARGALLGEETPKPPSETPQTQNTIQNEPPMHSQSEPPTQTDPIAKLLGRNVNFVTTNEEKSTELDFISIKDSGKEITKVFKPFAGNLEKQRRYEKFLKDREGFVREREGVIDKLSEWEMNRELVEFEQAAKLYRPLTGEMGDRFTHASEPDEALNPLCAVARSENNYGLATPDQIAAAEKGVYGVMTRTAGPWRPEPLVCKRFNVPDPMVARTEPQKEDKPKLSYSIFSYLENPVHDKESFAKEQTKFSGSKSLNTNAISKNKTNDNIQTNKNTEMEVDPKPSTSNETGFNKRLTVAELFMKESEKDMLKQSEGQEVTETIEKFDKMDLYKAIFLSDSEEDETSEEEEKIQTIDFDDLVNVPKNVERNNSPPRGIFANIDFDEINSWKRKSQDKNQDNNKNNKNQDTAANNNKSEQNELVNDEYGPKIPENLQKRLESEPKEDNFRPIFRAKTTKDEIHEVSSSSSDSWVEAKEIKSKKNKKKKSKKHKSKHKKSKHKKKDR